MLQAEYGTQTEPRNNFDGAENANHRLPGQDVPPSPEGYKPYRFQHLVSGDSIIYRRLSLPTFTK